MVKVNDTAANVRAELARQRVSHSALAPLLGMSRGGVSRRLNGETSFRVDELVKIAGLLGVPVESLISNGDTSVPA